MKKVWESTDGKIFDSWEECLEYENRCGKKLKSNNILNLGSKNFKRKTNLKQFYKVEELRIKLREENEERSQAFQWLDIIQKAKLSGASELETALKKYVKKFYSVDVDTTPLLTEDEELNYAKDVYKLTKTDKLYKAEYKSYKENESYELTKFEKTVASFYPHNQKEIFEKAEYAKYKLFEANLRLLISVVIKHITENPDSEENPDFIELMHKGRDGLLVGIEKFDPTKGYRFSHYAYWWIKHGIETNKGLYKEFLNEGYRRGD